VWVGIVGVRSILFERKQVMHHSGGDPARLSRLQTMLLPSYGEFLSNPAKTNIIAQYALEREHSESITIYLKEDLVNGYRYFRFAESTRKLST